MRLINRFRIRRALRATIRPPLGSAARITRRAFRRLNYMNRPLAGYLAEKLLEPNPLLADMLRNHRGEPFGIDRTAYVPPVVQPRKVVLKSAKFDFSLLLDPSNFNPSVVLEPKPQPIVLGVDCARDDMHDAFAYSVMGYMRRSVYDWFLPEDGRPQ